MKDEWRPLAEALAEGVEPGEFYDIADDFGLRAGFGYGYAGVLESDSYEAEIENLITRAEAVSKMPLLLDIIREFRSDLDLNPPPPPRPTFREMLPVSPRVALGIGAAVLVLLLFVAVIIINNSTNSRNDNRTIVAVAPTRDLPTFAATVPPTYVPTPTQPPPQIVAKSAKTSLTLPGAYIANGSAWSPQGKVLATAARGGGAQLWRPDGTAIAALKSAGQVTALAWTADGSLLATVDGTGALNAWRSDGTAAWAYKGSDVLTDVAWSPDGKTVALGTTTGTIQLVQAGDKPKALAALKGHTAAISSLAWSPDGTLIASGSSDKTVRLWAVKDALSLKEIAPSHTLTEHRSRVTDVLWSPDGRALATLADSMTVEMYDAAGAHTGTLTQIASPHLRWLDAQRLIWVDVQGATLNVWDASAKAIADTWPGAVIPIKDVAWSPDGRLVALYTGSQITICTADKTMSVRDNLPVGGGGVALMLWSADGSALAVRSAGSGFDLWRVVG